MTPLAYELLKDLTTPNGFRNGNIRDDGGGRFRDVLWAVVNEARFFDVTALADTLPVLADKMSESFDHTEQFARKLAFLPSPTTWIETTSWNPPASQGGAPFYQDRVAIIAHGRRGPTHDATMMMIVKDTTDNDWCYIPLQTKDVSRAEKALFRMPVPMVHSAGVPGRVDGRLIWAHFLLYAALALINTPRIIGRRQHMPHERIEREKIKALGLVGKFPLHAWTEIILKVAPPDDRTGAPSTEAHLTGERCLHFVRTFLRVRMGQLEYVDAHWRGNPALGIKRSRYRLEEGDERTQ
jgi:hypothetical protein